MAGSNGRDLCESVIERVSSRLDELFGIGDRLLRNKKRLAYIAHYEHVEGIVELVCVDGYAVVTGEYIGAIPYLRERLGYEIGKVFEALLKLKAYRGPYAFMDEYDRVILIDRLRIEEPPDDETIDMLALALIYLVFAIYWFVKAADNIDKIGPPDPDTILGLVWSKAGIESETDGEVEEGA